MSHDISLNSGLAQEKLYGLPKRLPIGNNPAAEKEVASQTVNREAALQWQKVLNQSKSEVDLQLVFSPSSEISSTTVVTPDAVKAPSQTLDIRDKLQQKFVELLEQTYAGSFHHNRLVAKVAEWTMGNIIGRLALLGMSIRELERIKKRIRQRLIAENDTAFCQVVYDETMLEIVG